MRPLALLRTDQPTARPALFVRLLDGPPDGCECAPASQAFSQYDAKDDKGGPHHDRPANLKPNIYYKAQDFMLGAHRVPGCRGASRADRHLIRTAGEESEPGDPLVDARLGPTETSSAPDRIAHAGFDEPLAWMVDDAACDC